MNCKVSVIVPVYNVEKFLDKCVGSIVNQTYSNLEIILVDDGSPDNCPAICEEWAKKDSRIKVIHKENGGLSSARNAGLDIFTGEYVMFVDSDDWIEPEMIETMLLIGEEKEADIVSCNLFIENVNGSSVEQEVNKSIYENQEIVRDFLLDKIRPEAWCKLYKAELIKKFRFDENRKYAEDLPFNFNVMRNAKKLVNTDIPFYHYTVNNDNSITASYITDARATSWKLFIDIIQQCSGNKELEEAAVFRFTVYIFAVLSRIIEVKEFKKKYFIEISDALINNKNKILSNSFVPQKHKKALKLLSFNRNIFKACFVLLKQAPKFIYTLKSVIAYFAFGFQAMFYIFKVFFEKVNYKDDFIFLLLTPCHENYGDQAIAYAEKQIFKDKHVFEITGDLLSRFVKYPTLLKIMLGKSTLLFQGGGYLGTFWFDYGEKILRSVMKIVPNNKIVVLPQSIYYENTKLGREQLEISKKIYSQCSNLVLLARDKISYNYMKEYYHGVEIHLVPDVVLYLNECYPVKRNGAMITFRNDIEKGILYSEQKKVEELAIKYFGEVKKVDMIADHRFSPKNREKELEVQFQRFRKSEIVFTDRLHGMIFSAITGTPCVVFPNKSHKVKGVYDWIFSDCEYIIFTDNTEEIKNFISYIKGKTFCFDNSKYIKYFDELTQIVSNN